MDDVEPGKKRSSLNLPALTSRLRSLLAAATILRSTFLVPDSPILLISSS